MGTINRHLASEKHKKRVKSISSQEVYCHQRQVTLETNLSATTAAGRARETLAIDLTEMMMSANIPIERSDNKSFRNWLNNVVPGGGGIPTAGVLRKLYSAKVEKIHNQQLQTIMDASSHFILIVDETSDNVLQRSVLNILITPINPLEPTDCPKSYLLEQVCLPKCNNSTVASACSRAVSKFNIPDEAIIAFVCDNVDYMKVAFRRILTQRYDCKDRQES